MNVKNLETTMLKFARQILFFFAPMLFFTGVAFAQHEVEISSESSSGSNDKAQEKEEFNAGEFVMEHVSDAYEWHIVTFGKTHVSIPLPVILYSKHPELHKGKALNNR